MHRPEKRILQVHTFNRCNECKEAKNKKPISHNKRSRDYAEWRHRNIRVKLRSARQRSLMDIKAKMLKPLAKTTNKSAMRICVKLAL